MYMGSCFSFTNADTVKPLTAKVITFHGSLTEYSVSVKVSKVLDAQHHPSMSYFLCNADSLYYDTYIPALQLGDSLQLGQIYFVLPMEKLENPLTGSDMAALAIKASSVLTPASKKKKSGWRKGIRVTPVPEVDGGVGNGELQGLKRFNEDSVGIQRRRPVQKKMGGTGSVRMRMAPPRPLRSRLSTIEEVITE